MTPNILLWLLPLILIPMLAIAAFVFSDARRRGMNAVFWALCAALVPAFLGLIIYLISRSEHSALRCPCCSERVRESYVICPGCGAQLRHGCPNCGQAVEPDWKVCPHCAAELTERDEEIHRPVSGDDHAVWRLVAIVTVIPLLLAGALYLGDKAAPTTGSLSFCALSFDDYSEALGSEPSAADIPELVQTWLNGLEPVSGTAYALRYKHDSGHYILLYVPGAGDGSLISCGQDSGIFGVTLKLELRSSGGGGSLICLSSSAETSPRLRLKLDGKRLDCEITDVDYNPTVYLIAPSYNGLEPGADDVYLPERITVTRFTDNTSDASVDIYDRDDMLSLLSALDSSAYLDTDDEVYRSGGSNYSDGYGIVLDYGGSSPQLTMSAFEKGGLCYLIDPDRPSEGRIFRQLAPEVYGQLEALFK